MLQRLFVILSYYHNNINVVKYKVQKNLKIILLYNFYMYSQKTESGLNMSNFLLKEFNCLKYGKEAKKAYINPLYKKDPVYYTTKGTIKKRFPNPFKYPSVKPKLKMDKVPEKIQDILIGCLLGDCGGEMGKGAKNPCFAFKQSVKHINYLYFLYFIFLHWGYVQPYVVPVIRTTSDSHGTVLGYVRFRTIATINLLKYYNMFYKYINGKRVKVVPSNIKYYLTPRALAYWIMDDGSKAKGSGILLHTNSYTYEEVLLLISILKQKFNIDSNPRKKYDRFLIYIEVESVPIVVKLVKVYMHPFFYYNIGEKESV